MIETAFSLHRNCWLRDYLEKDEGLPLDYKKLFVVLVVSSFAKRFSSTYAYIWECWIMFHHGCFFLWWSNLTGYGIPFVFRLWHSFCFQVRMTLQGLFRNFRCLQLLVLLFLLWSPLLPVLLFWHVLPLFIFRRVVVIAQTWKLGFPLQVLLLLFTLADASFTFRYCKVFLMPQQGSTLAFRHFPPIQMCGVSFASC